METNSLVRWLNCFIETTNAFLDKIVATVNNDVEHFCNYQHRHLFEFLFLVYHGKTKTHRIILQSTHRTPRLLHFGEPHSKQGERKVFNSVFEERSRNFSSLLFWIKERDLSHLFVVVHDSITYHRDSTPRRQKFPVSHLRCEQMARSTSPLKHNSVRSFPRKRTCLRIACKDSGKCRECANSRREMARQPSSIVRTNCKDRKRLDIRTSLVLRIRKIHMHSGIRTLFGLERWHLPCICKQNVGCRTCRSSAS